MKNIALSTIISLFTLGFCLQLHAEDFNVQPRAGLWQSDVTLLIDGKDVLAEVRALQQQLMANLPQSARAAAGMDAMMGEMDTETLSCITREQANQAKNIDQWIDQIAQEGCQINETSRSSNSIALQIQCDGSAGFKGSYQGKLTVQSEKAWTMTMQGKGSLGMGGPQAQQDITVSGKWVADDCGDIAREE